jgi:arginine-tRNA-protein transferase
MYSRLSYYSPPGPCGYLPGRVWRYENVTGRFTAAEYMARLDQGWRRFGHNMFRPACPSCRMCQSLRVPASTFRPDRSQRRAWKANHDVVVTVGSPALSDSKRELYEKFHWYRHEEKGWPLAGEDALEWMVVNPFPTEEWCYRLDDRLIGVGYVDRLSGGLSAIYFFHDPEERARSLGTFNVLSILEAARVRQLPYVYLGYYVEGYQSAAYKSRFRPNEVLGADGVWKPFHAAPGGP